MDNFTIDSSVGAIGDIDMVNKARFLLRRNTLSQIGTKKYLETMQKFFSLE